MNVGDDATTTVAVGTDPGRPVNAAVDVDLTTWVVNAGVGYDVAQADWGKFAVVGGVRYLSADIDSTIGLGGPFPLERSDSEDFWNGIVGFTFAYYLNRRGNREEAVAELHRLVQRHPDNKEARMLLEEKRSDIPTH